MPSPLTDLARRAFDAYGDRAQWTNVAGEPIPQWPQIGDRIQDCWEAAARAVHDAVAPPMPDGPLEE